MGMAFEIHGEGIHRYDFGLEKHWLTVRLGGQLIGNRRSWSPPWYPDIFLFYPEAHELRERLVELEADPTPLRQLGWDLDTAYRILRDFVKAYEKASMYVTPWTPVYLWQRDLKDRTILRDTNGHPLLEQKEPIHYDRLPRIVLC